MAEIIFLRVVAGEHEGASEGKDSNSSQKDSTSTRATTQRVAPWPRGLPLKKLEDNSTRVSVREKSEDRSWHILPSKGTRVALANLGRDGDWKLQAHYQTQSPEFIKLPKTLCLPSHCSSLRGLFPLLLWKRPSMDILHLWTHHCPISLLWLRSTSQGPACMPGNKSLVADT